MSVFLRNREQTTKKEATGFTLVEVMIAIVVLAVGLLALATMQMSAVRGNTFSYTLTDAKDWGADWYEKMMTDSRGFFNNPDLEHKQEDKDENQPSTYEHPAPPEGFTIRWTVADDQICPLTKTILMTITGTRFGVQRTVQLVYIM